MIVKQAPSMARNKPLGHPLLRRKSPVLRLSEIWQQPDIGKKTPANKARKVMSYSFCLVIGEEKLHGFW